jgi:hypothetical protein
MEPMTEKKPEKTATAGATTKAPEWVVGSTRHYAQQQAEKWGVENGRCRSVDDLDDIPVGAVVAVAKIPGDRSALWLNLSAFETKE